MVSEQDLLAEKEFLNEPLSSDQSYETQKEIFNRMAILNKNLKRN